MLPIFFSHSWTLFEYSRHVKFSEIPCPDPSEQIEFLRGSGTDAFNIRVFGNGQPPRDASDALKDAPEPSSVTLNPNDAISITSKKEQDDFRVMSLQFDVTGATSVVVTFIVNGNPEEQPTVSCES